MNRTHLSLSLILVLVLIHPSTASILEIVPQEPLGKDYLNLTSHLPEVNSTYMAEEREFLNMYPDNLSAWLIRGSFQLKIWNYTEAAHSFSKAIILDPKNRTAYLGLLQANLNNGNYESLLSNALKMSQELHDDASAKLYEGYALLMTGKYKEAIRIYDQLIKADSEPIAARYYKARTLSSLKEYQKSLDLYNETLRMDPGFAAAWAGIGFVDASGMKNRNSSMEAYDKAIALDKQYIRAYLSKAAVLSDIFNSSTESLQIYDKAIKLEPENPDLWTTKATALITLNLSTPGQYPLEEVLLLSENATRLAPSYWGGWNNQGCALLILHRYDEALEVYKKTVELAPKQCIARLNLGYAYFYLGKHEEAIKEYNQIDDCSSSLVATASTFKGNSMKALGWSNEALAAYDKAIQRDPSTIQAWDNKGDLLTLMGRYLDARSAYAKASENKNNSVRKTQ